MKIGVVEAGFILASNAKFFRVQNMHINRETESVPVLSTLYLFFRVINISFNEDKLKGDVTMNNNDERIYFCDTKDLKKGSFKSWCQDRINDSVSFYEEHKDFINIVAVPITLALIGLGKSGIRSAQANHRRKVEQRDKDMRFYDPSLKCWWQLNRRMTSTDKAMIAKRRAKGEKVASILKDMNLV